MGMFDFLLGDKIQRFVAAYDSYKRQLDPREEPHMILMNVLVNFKYRSRRLDPSVQSMAFGETMKYACLPYPDNAEALAYFFWWQSNSKEFLSNPKNEAIFEGLMKPFFEAEAKGAIKQLYAKHNPRLAKQFE